MTMRASDFIRLSLSRRAGGANGAAGHPAPASGGQQPDRQSEKYGDIASSSDCFAPPHAERTPVRVLCGRRLLPPLAGLVARVVSHRRVRTNRSPGVGEWMPPPSDRDEDGHSVRDTHEGPAVLRHFPAWLLLALAGGYAVGISAFLLFHGGFGG